MTDQADAGRADAAGTTMLAAMPRTRPGAVTVCTLGGVADIGMNFTLYGAAGKYLLVDAGTTFAPRDVAGVEAVMPDPKVLAALGDRLVGLLVSHGHEDHIGAIHRLWPKVLRCPIHATPFAARMLNGRLQDAGVRGAVDLRTFRPGKTLQVGPFRIETIPVAHSTPHCVAFSIEAEGRRILQTNDWKRDLKPGLGGATDLAAFAALGDRGVDLMLCDSTNADREVPSTSESSVEVAMEAIFRKAKGAVFVSSFGSNVARMASVAIAAQRTQRKVALAGRSLRNAAEYAHELRLLDGVPRFVDDPSKLASTQRRGRVIMCTGTQGEENAALTKIAEGRTDPGGRIPEVLPGDVVVHSARVIPGNEEYVHDVLDKLRARGARVITADEVFDGAPVHVTGHPCRDDLRAMYAAVRPRLAMPVHGTPMHLEAHAELALAMGAGAATTPVNGGVYELDSEGLVAVGRLRQGCVAVLGDGAGTLVGWDEGSKVPVMGEAERAGLDAHVERERAKAARRLERTAAGGGRDARGRRPERQGSERQGSERQGRAGRGSGRRAHAVADLAAGGRDDRRARTAAGPTPAGASASPRTFQVVKTRPPVTKGPGARSTPASTPATASVAAKPLDRGFIEAMNAREAARPGRDRRGRRPAGPHGGRP